ncbi:hypothetical protein [Mesorhizobium sp.]|uniref:hypothetical protein n=1 Tax=Mesorhizobium sp. TaxID=1871066 RepID=UPI000FE6417B|nr:hypothetical protein [Mesorhizobium sp.]RWO08236.1 MAG: hypothetical protein EOS15_29930 [Mesorhizobium sp.]
MSAFFTPEQLELLAASTVRADFLITFEFLSATERAWNGNQALPANDGNTYLPMFGFGSVEGLGLAGQGTVSESVTISLDGLPGQALDWLSQALANTADVNQQMVTVALQLFSEDWQPVGLPIPVFRGFMQPPRVSRSTMSTEAGATQSISVTAENIFFGRSRPPFGRNTDRDQQARYPGDKFFGFVNSLLFKTITYPDF